MFSKTENKYFYTYKKKQQKCGIFLKLLARGMFGVRNSMFVHALTMVSKYIL